MATGVWRYFVHRSNDGEPVGEIQLEDVRITENLSAGATLTGTMSLDDPAAARALTAPWLREITASRDDYIAFHGPIVLRAPLVGQRRVSIAAASPHAYLYKRVTEYVKNYTRDQFSIVRDLIALSTAKTGGSLYRFTVTQTNSGVTKIYPIGSSERRRVSQIIEELSSDPDTGFDFRYDYTWANLAQRTVSRSLRLGYPVITRDLTASRVFDLDLNFVDFTDTEDGMNAANRIHVLGATLGTTGSNRLRAVANSGTSLNAGYPLLEEVFERTNIKNQAVLNQLAANIRNNVLPGARALTSRHAINSDLPLSAIDLGDKVRVNLRSGAESINTSRRIVTQTITPATDVVEYVYWDPTSGA